MTSKKIVSLVNKLIATQSRVIALRVRYVLESGGIQRVFRKQRQVFIITQKRSIVLKILSVTMTTSQLLVLGGIVGTLRDAQKKLKNLCDAGYSDFIKYPILGSKALQKFYFLTTKGFSLLNKTEKPYHKIQASKIKHDLLTAIYLIHWIRCCNQQNLELEWYEPFAVQGKVVDGAVALYRNQEVFASIILEADNATHDHKEISEKIAAYIYLLEEKKNRRIVFLAYSQERAKNLRQTIQANLVVENEHYAKKILVICPFALKPNVQLFRIPPEDAAPSRMDVGQDIKRPTPTSN
jgi:hypothetical protein